jgi:mRNA interferase HigB
MRVISEKKPREFWTEYPESEGPLRAWIKVASEASWGTFAEVRETYATASQVGKFTVFNIGGNKFRLVVVIHFNRGRLFIRHVMTHEIYDKGHWKKD